VRNKKLAAALVPSLWAAAALLLTSSVIAEIAAEPTAAPGVTSSVWTPITSVTALFSGVESLHGSFDLPSVLFGLVVILLASVIAGSLAAAFLIYCLGWNPPPAAAALLGAALGLAAEILLINLLCNWLQSDNGIYTSLPSWAWFPAFGAWGICLGLSLATRQPEAVEGPGVGLAGPSPLLSAESHPGSPHASPGHSPLLSADPHPTAPHPSRTAPR
jgi:hypothetical protein